MDFKEILNRNTGKKEVILGFNENEELVINIDKTPSIIITGETGTGKSILLDQILLQLINKNTSLELGIIPIDTSGVELNYYRDSKYTLYNAINDMDKSVVALSRVLREIDRRKDLLNQFGVTTVDEYNKVAELKLPTIVVAIDDDKMLLREPDLEKMLTGIISQLAGLNILFVLATSDAFNKFFETDKNIYASLLITFDYTNTSEAKNINIEGAQDLGIGYFIARQNSVSTKYHNFEFEDSLIEDILNK